MTIFSLFITVFFCLALILGYFSFAKRFDVLDKPNHRSSHQHLTIRGGGILFPIAGIMSVALYDQASWPYALALLLLAIVSFWDDLRTISGGVRMGVHVFSVGFFMYSLHPPVYPVLLIPVAIAIIGAMNIYNFMDGINGITGLYSAVVLFTLWYLNTYKIAFTEVHLILLPLIAVLVFNIFNVRKHAVCFAGDVGSVSIAFICLFLIVRLIVATHDLVYSGLLLVYGLDGVSTILFRVVRKEKLSEAHRSHFYQYLANERAWPHIGVSALFAAAQLLFNVILVFDHPPLLVYLNLVLFLFFAWVGLRIYMQGPQQLFSRN